MLDRTLFPFIEQVIHGFLLVRVYMIQTFDLLLFVK